MQNPNGSSGAAAAPVLGRSASVPAPARIGDPLSEVDTPALIVELDAFERNLARMAAKVAAMRASGGNPALQPYKSTAYDISIEKYFSPGSAIIVAAFHKDLSDWVLDFSELADLTQSINNAGFGAILGNRPDVAIGRFSGPVNFADGKITGVEGTVRVNFGDLTDALDGFGGFYSITYSDAEVQNQNFNPIAIPGYSDITWSGDIFYEKHGFRAKLAARHRSGFLSEVQNFAGQLQGADAQPETILDAQIGYTFEKADGFLNGVQILAEVFNLTNEPQVTENDLFNAGGQVIGTFPSRHELFGRTFNLTIRKNF